MKRGVWIDWLKAVEPKNAYFLRKIPPSFCQKTPKNGHFWVFLTLSHFSVFNKVTERDGNTNKPQPIGK